MVWMFHNWITNVTHVWPYAGIILFSQNETDPVIWNKMYSKYMAKIWCHIDLIFVPKDLDLYNIENLFNSHELILQFCTTEILS